MTKRLIPALALTGLAAASLALGGCKAEKKQPPFDPAPVPSGFTVENPTEPAVPVDLPTTRNAKEP